MKNKCLYCYETLDQEIDFHKKCSLKFFGTAIAPTIPYELDQMIEMAKQVVERSVTVPGVQSKLSLSLVNSTKGDRRLTVVGALGGQYIFKPPTNEYPEMPQNEHVTMRIAEAFGINTVPSSLIRLQSGEIGYITKRIDRAPNGEKYHMLDMLQILEAYDKYRGGSMEKIGKALHEYSSNTLLDKLLYFEIVLFSFVTGNNDMHLKNFSMINSKMGWNLSPAYDLLNVNILNPRDSEELALTLGGKKKKFNQEHFEIFGKGLGLSNKQIQGAFKRLNNNKNLAHEWVNNSFLSFEMREKYAELLNERFLRV